MKSYRKSLEIQRVVSEMMRVAKCRRWVKSSVEMYAARLWPNTAMSPVSSNSRKWAGLQGKGENGEYSAWVSS